MFSKYLTAAIALLLLLFVAVQASAETPNVVLIFADDLGYGDLGCYGATHVRTPNIDRLAGEGRRFTDAHSASAVCTPSRYALLTGEYPFRRNLSKPVFLKSGLVVDPDRTTVADVMKKAGYTTACIGKWHLGFGEETPDWNGELKPGPLELGFDYYFGVPVVNSHPPFVFVENHRVVGLVPDDPFVYGTPAKTQPFQEKMGIDLIGGADAAHALYRDEAVGTQLTEKAVAWIKENQQRPFFLYLATTNIHHPFTPAPRFQGTSQCGRYGDFIHELDWIVGEVLSTLTEHGLADNTLVILTSDNGGMINQGGQDAVKAGHKLNGDLLGFKFDAWEGGHRVPFIARWPGKIAPATVSDQLIANIDLLATLAALTDQPLPPEAGPDSINVLSALTGNPDKPLREHLVLAPSSPNHLSIRSGKWMFISGQGGGGFGGRRPGEHLLGGPAALKFAGQVNSDVDDGKLKADAPTAQLYDLQADFSQSRNVYRDHPDVVQQMSDLLAYCQTSQQTRPDAIERSETSVRPGINDSFLDANLDITEWLGRFEVESREIFAARHEIVKAVGIRPGDRVADVGAGTGIFTRLFSEAVGGDGWVFAVDISPRFIEHINARAQDDRLTNVTAVLCPEDSVSLPPQSIDIAFVCDTYHHFEYPQTTLRSIHRALRAGGTLIVIDFERIPGKSREFVMNHVRAGKEVFRSEMEAAGFEFVEEVKLDGLQENYVLRMKKKGM